jgi:hypothetical protein
MFRTVPVAEPAPDVKVPADLISLSVLALDLPEPSGVGWAAYLADRGIAIVLDEIGRAAITKADARSLFDERRENEARAGSGGTAGTASNRAGPAAACAVVGWYSG